MSHETESPDPPPGEGAEPEDPLPFNRALSARPPRVAQGPALAPRIPRSPTISGIGTTGSVPAPPLNAPGSVPAPPLTEVTPAMRPPLSSDVVEALAFVAAPGEVEAVDRPRPSETMVGSLSPLHTADDANTAVDATSLTPGDAERIIAAADAERAAATARRQTKMPPGSAALPPPPPLLRRTSAPPPRPAAGAEVALPPHASLKAAPVPSPLPSPTSARTSYPPPPPRKANTLLLYAGTGAASEAPATAAVKPEASPSKSEPPKAGARPLVSSSRPPPPVIPIGSRPPLAKPSRPPPPVRAAAEVSEELSSALLADDSGAHGAVPAPISSSSLIDDSSAPELEPDEDTASRVVASPPEPPKAPEPATLGGAFAAVGADQAHAASAVPEGILPLAEPPGAPESGPPELSDPFARPTDITSRPRNRVARPSPQPTWLLPALAAGGALALVVTVSLAVIGVRAYRARAVAPHPGRLPLPSAEVPTASATPPPPVAEGASSAPPPQALPEPTTGGPCVLAGAPHTVAPRALLRAGVETAASADRIALGVALGEREGFVVSLDPSTFVATASAKARSDDPIRRVVPLLGASSDVRPFFETSRKHAPLEAPHPAPAEPPFLIGVAARSVVWALSSTSASTPLWSLPGETPVDAVRVVALPEHGGFVVAFRQGASVYLGAMHEDKTPNGDLVRIGGLGPQIGAPTLAAGPEHVLVAWADRVGPSAPWGIRWLPWHPGTEPGQPTAFPLARTGAGASSMSPSLTAITGGRYVVAWTEGAGARHEVRAQALDSADHPIGTALTVSAEGVNAGQGVPALTADGRGAIVFLSTPQGASASVVAVPIVCP